MSIDKEFKWTLNDLVSEWAMGHSWDSEEAVSSAIAGTNAIFDEIDIINIEIDESDDDDEYRYYIGGKLYGSPRKDDVPFCGDTIIFSAQGVITYHLEYSKWDVEDPEEVDAKIEDWTGASSIIREVTMSSPDDLLVLISRFPNRYWYRGHADAQWELKAGIARKSKASLELEEELRLTYEKQTAFLDQTSYPHGIVRRTFSMQHYGLPTRLLDWSSSPLTALHFAVHNADADEFNDLDACLWVIDPRLLNRQNAESFPYQFSDDADDMFAVTADWAVAIHAPYADWRMKVQQSEFTFHAGYEALEKMPGAAFHLKQKIVIPSDMKMEVRERLASLGITQASLFPDRDHIAAMIKRDLLGG